MPAKMTMREAFSGIMDWLRYDGRPSYTYHVNGGGSSRSSAYYGLDDRRCPVGHLMPPDVFDELSMKYGSEVNSMGIMRLYLEFSGDNSLSGEWLRSLDDVLDIMKAAQMAHDEMSYDFLRHTPWLHEGDRVEPSKFLARLSFYLLECGINIADLLKEYEHGQEEAAQTVP